MLGRHTWLQVESLKEEVAECVTYWGAHIKNDRLSFDGKLLFSVFALSSFFVPANNFL